MPLLRFLLVQLIAWALIFVALALGAPLAGSALALAQGLCAALIGFWIGAAAWWLIFHLAFVPLIWLSSQMTIAPGWFLAAFVVMALFYWTTFRTQVPLFLSNRNTVDALARLLPTRAARVLDAGAGTGSALRPLASERPDCQFVGVEAAPAPWLIGHLLAGKQHNLEWRRGDMWSLDWSDFDVVYVFLSPVPMARVWAKACAEMRPGSRLVSNSFEIPDVAPERVIPARAGGGRTLFVYAPAAAKTTADKHKKTASVPSTSAATATG